MSNSGGTDPFGFGRFIPGFEFLQGMSQTAAGASPGGAGQGAQAPFPGMSQWIAPTVSIEDIDKRIQELRAVQFWIEQNGRALTATIQALEVQKMTLAALQSMQGGLGEWAKAAPFKMPEAGAAPAAASPTPASPPPAAAPEAPSDAAAAGADTDASGPAAGPGMGAVDPLQWWGALTQQFQQIATQAMQDPANQKAMAAGTQMASDFARNAMQSAADLAKAQAPQADQAPPPAEPPQAAAPEPAAKPAAARKTPRRPS